MEERDSSTIHFPALVRNKSWQCMRVALPCVLIIGVWTGFSLPIVLYHLPISENTSGANTSGSDSMCSAPLQYATNSGVCLREFENILTSSNCSPDPEGNVFVVRNEETTVTQLIQGLTNFGESDECINKSVPFWCMYVFGLCGGSGVSIKPTTSQCEEVRDTLCAQEWVLAQRHGINLPDCAMFPPEALSCPALSDGLSTSITEKHSNGTRLTLLECTEDFYRENGSSICIPNCYTWTQNSKGLDMIGDVVSLTALFIGLLAAIAAIIISCLARKRMLVYPTIFIVYITIDILVLTIFVMVGYLKYDRLFCSSRSLIQSRMEVTPFCVISGIVFTYVFFQIALWWLFHLTTLYWQVIFPFHAHTFETTGKNKYIHIICITLGILLPLVPIITTMADFAVDLQKQNKTSTSQPRNSLFLSGGLGFKPRTYPAVVCFGEDENPFFYGGVLMLDIIMALGCSLIIIICSSLHKAHIKRKQMQAVNNGHQFSFGKAEKKLLAVLCYYVILLVIAPIPLTLNTRNLTQFFDTLQKYFYCEQGGHDPSHLCSRSDIESNGNVLFGIFINILLALYPIMNLMYVVNTQELKKVWMQFRAACITH